MPPRWCSVSLPAHLPKPPATLIPQRGHLLPAAPLPGYGFGSVGIHKGPWLMWGACVWHQHPLLSAQPCRETLASHAGSPSLEHTFLWAQGASAAPRKRPAVVEPASSPSITLISQRWQPSGPCQWGYTDSRPGLCSERQAGGTVVISHAANKNNNSPPW